METILIYRLGSIGDTVVALPCFHKIASSFPNANRVVLTNNPISSKAAPLASVLEKSGLIQGTINYETGERRIAELVRIRNVIRSLNVKSLIYLAAPRGRLRLFRDLAFFKLCGVHEIIGAPISADRHFLRVDPKTGEVEREAERLARCLSGLGPVDIKNPQAWDLLLTVEEKQRACEELRALQGREFAAINIGGKVIRNDWGNDNWGVLLRLLWSKMPGLGLAFIGAADEHGRNAMLAKAWPGVSVNLCGILSPRESAAVIKLARIFVGHDSGPMHLAASVGTPCVAIFGDNNPPKKWHPFGSKHRIIHNMAGVHEIRPEDVFASIYSVLTQVCE